MACSDFSTLYEFWAHLQFFDGVNCYFEATAGGAVPVQLLVFSTLGLSLYVYSREPIVVLVLGILFGGIMVAPLPAAVVNTALLIGVVMTAVVIFLLARRAKSGRFA